MINLKETLKKHDLRATSYKKIGKTILIDSNIGKIVLKKKTNNDIYNYLLSRSFNYYPDVIIEDEEYLITPFLEEIKMPKEQKMTDMIKLLSLLHNKTAFYKNVDFDEYKKNYEDLKNNIKVLNNYYNKLLDIIDSKVYPDPFELLLEKNCSIIFNALKYCDNELDKWYLMVKDKTKRRYTVIHNNLSMDHFIRGEDINLISWDNSKIDLAIYDLYKLYKKYALDYDFEMILKKYEANSPLLKEEKKLFNILISMPEKIEVTSSIYENTIKVSKLIDYLYLTEKIVLPENLNNTKENK